MNAKPTTIRMIALLLAGLSLGQPAPAGEAEIRIRPAAEVRSGAVCLQEIADIQCENQELKDRLANLIIAGQQPDGGELVLGTLEITAALAQAQIHPAGIDIYGASQCRVKTNCAEQTADLPSIPLIPQKEPAVLSIPESILSEPSSQEPNDDMAGITLSDQLTDTVAQMMDLDKASLKIEWQCKDPSWLQQRAGSDRFKIVPLSPIRLGQIQFAVTDLSLREPENRRQGDPGRCKVSGKVEFLCESVVAAQALRPGQVITPEMVKRMPRRVTSFREVGITDLDYVVGQEVARAVSENELVLPGMIRKVQLVKRNEYVDVIAKVGQVEIRQRCKALAGGAYGDVILVRDETNKRTVQGRITAARQVNVMEESVPEKEVLLSKEFISSASEKRYQEN